MPFQQLVEAGGAFLRSHAQEADDVHAVPVQRVRRASGGIGIAELPESGGGKDPSAPSHQGVRFASDPAGAAWPCPQPVATAAWLVLLECPSPLAVQHFRFGFGSTAGGSRS